MRTVVDSQRSTFESFGCRTDEAEPDFTDFDAVFKTLRALAFLTGVAPRIAGRRAEVKATIRWEIDRGERLTPADIASALATRTELFDRMRRLSLKELRTLQAPLKGRYRSDPGAPAADRALLRRVPVAGRYA